MPRDIEVILGDNTLERGDVLRGDIVRGRLYGPEGAPVIIVMGGISASRHVADGGKLGRGWWSTLVREGGPIDCLLYTSPSPRDKRQSRMPSSA